MREDRFGLSDHEFDRLYRELRRIAARFMRNQRNGHTLEPTALVHEVIVRFLDAQTAAEQVDVEHLRARLILAMARLLVDHARKRGRLKRGGHRARVSLSIANPAAAGGLSQCSLVELGDVLNRIREESDERYRTLVLRIWTEMTIEEVAAFERCSVTTVKERTALAKSRFLELWEKGER